MKHFIVVLFCLAALTSVAQTNLVPNPSFENYLNCPTEWSQVPYSNNYSSFLTVSSWSNPMKGSDPDYYNVCAPATPAGKSASVPTNAFGSQLPRTGDAYMGINIFATDATSPPYYSEYIYCKLTQPLQADTVYYVSFYVSATFAPSSEAHATDRIGAHFSDTIVYNDVDGSALTLSYHIRNDTGDLIDDTENWTKIRGRYTAKGGEEYMYIGCFHSENSPISFKQINPPNSNSADDTLSYYYIDDVYVSITPQCDTFIDAYDSALCSKESTTLISPVTDATSYTWNQGQDGNSINVTEPGTYWCYATKYSCDYYIDTFVVSNTMDTLRDSKTATICQHDEQDVLLLSSTMNADRYEWSTGSDRFEIIITEPGEYSCTAIEGCTVYVDDFTIKPTEYIDSLNIGDDTTLCEDVAYNLGERIPFDTRYRWSTGDTTCCIEITLPGDYVLSATDGCANLSDTITISYKDCSDCIWVPTAFTPNRDGLNDLFSAHSRCPIVEYQITIVNRWGQEVFNANDIQTAWDGKQRGYFLDAGIYFYIIKYRSVIDDEPRYYKGEVTLIR